MPANKYVRRAVLLLLVGLFITTNGCQWFDRNEPATTTAFDFRESDHGWNGFFTGYNVGWEKKMELTSGHESLPEPLDTDDKGLMISAVNNSDDVKMLFRRQVQGLEPHTRYNVQFTVRFATDEPSGCSGIGGSPGGSVRVLADASTLKPEKFVGQQGSSDYYRLNVQYQLNNPAQWYERVVFGDIANSRECADGEAYEIKQLDSGASHTSVTTDSNGRAWLLFGTRSGFEGRTTLYYTHFDARFTRF